MKERPILFSTPMVKAVLTQIKDVTRRTSGLDVVNEELTGEVKLSGTFVDINGKLIAAFNDGYRLIHCACPYGQPGDILWVRETWSKIHYEGVDEKPSYFYKADGMQDISRVWKPSIHMPKDACRLKLKIVSIQVERLHDITEEDAIREGLSKIGKDGITWKYGIPDSDGLPGTDNYGWPWVDWNVSAKRAFETLWAKINGQESWDSNPWVWRIEFTKL